MADYADSLNRAYPPPVEGDDVDEVPWNAELDNLVNGHNAFALIYNELVDENDADHSTMSESISGNTAAIGVINTNVTNNTTQIGLNGANITQNSDDIAQNTSDISDIQLGLHNLTVAEIETATATLDDTYENYDCILCRYAGDTTITVSSAEAFEAANGREFWIVAGGIGGGVTVTCSDWLTLGVILGRVYLRQGEALHIGIMRDSSGDYSWALMGKSDGPIKVARLTPSSGTALTKYGPKMQSIEAYQANTSVTLPQIDSSMDGMEFIIIGESGDAGYDLVVTGAVDDVVVDGSTVTSVDLQEGQCAHFVAVYGMAWPPASSDNYWIVVSNSGDTT